VAPTVISQFLSFGEIFGMTEAAPTQEHHRRGVSSSVIDAISNVGWWPEKVRAGQVRCDFEAQIRAASFISV
jgi:hypothetical protein